MPSSDFLKQVVKLEQGIPSHDTFSRVFRRLKPEPFEAAFAKFTGELCWSLEGGGGGRRQGLARRLRAGSQDLASASGQRPGPSRPGWSSASSALAPGRNEALGASRPWPCSISKGCIVTADALHCRADTAEIILKAGADYALAVKANQPTLLAKAQALIEAADPATEAIQVPAKVHGRIEAKSRALVVQANDI